MFAVINIQNFCLQAVLRHEPGRALRPAALVDPESPKPEIVQLNSFARQHGVVEGLTASQAMARCPALAIKTRSRPQEGVATNLLLQTAYAFTPNMEATGPGICTLDLKGLGLQNTEVTKWASQILASLAQFHIEGTIGLASTPHLALLAARMAEPILHVQDRQQFISTLPLAALQPPPEAAEILFRWGIRTAGEFLALGKNDVAERLGEPALALFDQVSSDNVRPLKLVPAPAEFAEQMEFEHEIETVEPLLFVLRRFVEQISRRLEMIHRVVAEFQLQLGLASGVAYEHTFKIPSPTGEVEALFRTLFTGLEGLRLDSPIVSLRLDATPARLDTHQLGLFEVSLRNPNQFSETLARLTALCGPDRVGSPVLKDTCRPDAFELKTPDFAATFQVPAAKDNPCGLQLRRFRPAISATVEFRQRQPVLISSLLCRGAIKHARGPFFGSGDWWGENRWAREEWDIETTESGLYRIVILENGCFVEGVYD